MLWKKGFEKEDKNGSEIVKFSVNVSPKDSINVVVNDSLKGKMNWSGNGLVDKALNRPMFK